MITYKIIIYVDVPYAIDLYSNDNLIARVSADGPFDRDSLTRSLDAHWGYFNSEPWDVDEAYMACLIARDELLDRGLL